MTPLYWRPKPPEPHYLPEDMELVLQRRYLPSGAQTHTFDRSDILYLQGLLDAGVEGARALIKAIEEHGPIEVIRRP